ncbi:MAG: hypothetical protein AAFU64_21020, partial [Bacteroidota bacterium]
MKAATDRYGFIEWSAMRHLRREIDQLLRSAEQHLEKNQPQSAFFILSAIMEEMTEALQFADDSDGDISGSIGQALYLLTPLVESNDDESLRKEILAYCFSILDKKIYQGWDWHTSILELAADMVKTEKEVNQILVFLDEKKDSTYEEESQQKIKYQLLHKLKREAEADRYLQKHINNPYLRRIAILKAMDHKNYAKAQELAQAGVAHDAENKPGLAKEWQDFLLEIAQAQGNTKMIIEYARLLLIHSFRDQQDYQQILKEQIPAEEWKPFLEAVIQEIATKNRWPNYELIAQIFIKEEWWDRLMQMVRNNPS